MEQKIKFDISSGNYTPINHRGVCTKHEAQNNLSILSLFTQFPWVLMWISNTKDLWSHSSLPLPEGPFTLSIVSEETDPGTSLHMPPVTFYCHLLWISLWEKPQSPFSLLSASLGHLNSHSQQPLAEICLSRSLAHSASNSSRLLLIQSVRITTLHYLYKQRF